MRPSGTARRGFTALELMISLVVMGMIGLATLGITTAVATGHAANDGAQRVQIASRQAAAQLHRQLHTALYVGLAASDGVVVTSTSNPSGTTAGLTPVNNTCSSGSNGAALFFWKGDTVDAGYMNLCEIALIERNPVTKDLVLYQIPATAANATVRYHPSDIAVSSNATSFKALPNVISQTLAHNVTAVAFNSYLLNGSSVPKLLEFTLTLADGEQKRVVYGCVSLKASRNSTTGL